MGSSVITSGTVGRTGLNLTRIGFGGAPLGDIRRAPENEAAYRVLQGAWDAGIRYFDTAPMYGCGLSERRIGDFLRDKPRDSYVLSTKVGRLLVPDRAHALRTTGDARAMPFRHVFDFSYDATLRSFEQSLQRLGLERIDILYLHDIGRFSQRQMHEESLRIALAGAVKALVKLREQGAVKAIGLGVNEWQICDELMNHARWDVHLLANRYTLLDQEVLDHFLPRCVNEGVMLVDGAPLNGGILATGAIPGAHYNYAPPSAEVIGRIAAIEAICSSHGVPMAAVALNFPLGHEAIAAVIPGFARPSDLDNLAFYREAIPDGLWADLREAGLLHPAAPIPRTPVFPEWLPPDQ
jgi:D-threo-aldose 1-dehydrogenase